MQHRSLSREQAAFATFGRPEVLDFQQLPEIESEKYISLRGSKAQNSEKQSRECSGQKAYISPEYMQNQI